MEGVCDLHTHSVFSDGTYTPTQLVEEAEEIGLSAIALTDHNTVSGLPEFLEAARGKNLEAVPGVEFSTDYRGIDLHIVALYVQPEQFHRVNALMEEGVRQKDASNAALVEALARAGYPMDYEAMKAATPNGQINRAHIAAEMVRHGWVSTIQEAFPKFLNPDCGYYTPPRRPDVFEIIRFIREIGAVPVMAHPFLKLDEQGVCSFLEQACPCGLMAMETVYVSFDAAATACAKNIAKRFGLLESGGSDFHGQNKPGIHLGVGRGHLAVPLAFRDRIRAAAAYRNPCL